MCGITGFYDQQMRGTKEVIVSMTKTLSHRGPDDSGVEFWSTDSYQLAFGHERLSIIDIRDSGHQPMFSTCRNFCIVFNGEIYNYKELKKQLILEGVDFQTQSDTEVLVALYKSKGTNFLSLLRGMFAFVIVDFQQHKLFAARDHVGVKPFYYHFYNGLFLFSSELKAFFGHPGFEPRINHPALADFLRLGYIAGNKTIYQHTHKLEKGHFLEFNLLTSALQTRKYWDIKTFFSLPKIHLNQHALEEELLVRLIEAFKYRLVSDVPIGVFLSGGYDSTLLTAILTKELNQNLKTFTIGFEESEFDESIVAKRISENFETDHQVLTCTELEASNLVEKLPYTFDEPFSDPSAIPTMLLSKWTRSQVKVALSADGGDENFAGYNRYLSYRDRITSIKNTFSGISIPSLARIANFMRLMLPSSMDWISSLLLDDLQPYLLKANRHLKEKQIEKLLKTSAHAAPKSRYQTTDLLDQMLLWDIDNYLSDDVLVKVDRASMAFGLESREPLLDYKLMEYTAQIPFNQKCNEGVLKNPIKSLVHRYIDKDIINRPKQGFSPPLEKWMKTIFAEEFADLTATGYIRDQGLFDPKQLHTIVQSTSPDYLKYRVIWSLFVFQKWHQHWMK